MSEQGSQRLVVALTAQDHTTTNSEQIAAEKNPLVPDGDGSGDSIFTRFYTKPQLANELKRNLRTLDRWNALGTGPPRTVIGRLVLYRRTSVQRWLAAQEQSCSPPP